MQVILHPCILQPLGGLLPEAVVSAAFFGKQMLDENGQKSGDTKHRKDDSID